MAKEIVPAGCEGGDSTRLLILRSTDTIPHVGVEIFALDSHLSSTNQVIFTQF